MTARRKIAAMLGPEQQLAAIFAEYPALAKYRDQFALMLSPDPGDGRQLEYYPPWEDRSPVPGKATVELYNTNESPDVTQNLIAGDMLHYMGAIDPRTGKPVDPTYYNLKQQVLRSRTPEQRSIDWRAYQHDLPYYESPPDPAEWMQSNRGDAYMRGKLTPDAQDDWRDMYTPDQTRMLEKLRQYLLTSSTPPGIGR
jgi:hypothetical protein